MHPQVLEAKNGLCSICGMELTPKKTDTTAGARGGSAVVIDPVMVQNIGVRTAEVIHGRLRRIVRSVGTLLPQPESRVADTTAMAIKAHTSQSNLPFLREGQQVEVRFAALPGEKHKGKLAHVAPDLDTVGFALLRVELDPVAPTLRPGMQATIAVFAMTEEETLLAPRDAIIDSGTRRVAFVMRGAGRFEPRELRIAASADDWVQVLEGLDKGDRVVTSGQFLLDSESRMQQAIEKYRSGWVPPAAKPEASH